MDTCDGSAGEGPDMGMNETSMAFVHDEIGRAVGPPAVLGGRSPCAAGPDGLVDQGDGTMTMVPCAWFKTACLTVPGPCMLG